eukprot:CAMPEP_0116006322 /NCGR_PEP_ID=MMETSP0321-20121206/1665_1 /TAXON_ID=163516 /ORGANISM="Leptocylindrus danicus var. danicus, Strain B650" /LENGTH=242 /DNA_ID=CAMNT_0003474865 /DNA_START=147 /DNA_END=875 /DNA_ORIENTATION=+
MGDGDNSTADRSKQQVQGEDRSPNSHLKEFEEILRNKFPKLKEIVQDNGISIFSNGGSAAQDMPPLHANDAEVAIIENVIKTERSALFYSMVAGALSFASLRYAPRMIVHRFGSADKIKTMVDGEKLRSQTWRGKLGNVMSFVFETFVGTYIGTQTYQFIHRQRVEEGEENIYQQLAQIPLVEGESIVSDTLCADWLSAHKNVPQSVWDSSSDDDDSSAFQIRKAIDTFAQNCIRRNEINKK